MNTRRFIMTSTVFLIEAGKYDLAAYYMIKDIFENGTPGVEINGKKPSVRALAGELEHKHDIVRKQSPSGFSIEKMREMAGEVYQEIYKSLLTGKAGDSLIYEEKPSL